VQPECHYCEYLIEPGRFATGRVQHQYQEFWSKRYTRAYHVACGSEFAMTRRLPGGKAVYRVQLEPAAWVRGFATTMP
jgi:hypothetical protein